MQLAALADIESVGSAATLYNKMVKAKGDRIKDLQMRLDRAEDTIEEMVESRREYLDV